MKFSLFFPLPIFGQEDKKVKEILVKFWVLVKVSSTSVAVGSKLNFFFFFLFLWSNIVAGLRDILGLISWNKSKDIKVIK